MKKLVMRHRGLIIGVGLALGAMMFLVVWLLALALPGGLWLALGAGLLTAAATVLVCGTAYRRCTSTLRHLMDTYKDETLLYSDVAGLMQNGRERPGALMVTSRRLVFETPPGGEGQSLLLDYPFGAITGVRNHKAFLLLEAGAAHHRFKVFRCNTLVHLAKTGMEAAKKAEVEEMAATAPEKPIPPAASPPAGPPSVGQ